MRALINVADVPEKGLVADPMCGSGTAVVEAVLGGYKGLGLDANPLSVLMSRTKCALLSVEPESLIKTYNEIRDKLLSLKPARSNVYRYFSTLPVKDQEYLRTWFSEQVLVELDTIAGMIYLYNEGPIRDLLRLSLSNIIRSVSWQKDDDLRVRKEVRLDVDIDPVKEFLEELGRSIRTVLAFLYQNKNARCGNFEITEGDARESFKHWKKWLNKIDAVITSPPYATALPYLDTDRLSLCFLGLLPRPEHRKRDLHMIGNREVTEKIRQLYWLNFQENKSSLPESIIKLIEEIASLNKKTEVGFRRKNLPALLAKYFFDMKDVLEGIQKILKPGAPVYIVIGNNHTIAGGEKVDIKTADILVDLAESIGFVSNEHVPMEMLVSRDIFKKNSVGSEVILSFSRP